MKIYKEFELKITYFYNTSMYKLYSYFTNDGSIGLFSPEADDIYHSTYGALSEAYEKFIIPANLKKYFNSKKQVNVLDICYGIGYNSKSLLNYFLENFATKKNCQNNNIDTVYTNKQNSKKEHELINIDKIDTNNVLSKIFIHAVDTDKNLVFLSPFFKAKKNIFDKNDLTFNNDKISKMRNNKFKNKYKLKKSINYILLQSIVASYPEIFEDIELKQLINNKEYSQYFDKSVINFYRFLLNYWYKYGVLGKIISFLHNIYYQHISKSNKIASKYLLNKIITFKLEINDARKAIKNSNLLYDVIFLDAFTPAKCPCLWSYQFMCELYKHLNDDGIILTYSNSANIRNAFVQAGFYIGKIYNHSSGKYMGTVAVKNKKLINENNFIDELSDYDIGLLNTKAGITYQDPQLKLSNQEIINNHKIEVENSNLESSSKYIKRNKKGN